MTSKVESASTIFCIIILPNFGRTIEVKASGSCVLPHSSDKVSIIVRMSFITTDSFKRFCKPW